MIQARIAPAGAEPGGAAAEPAGASAEKGKKSKAPRDVFGELPVPPALKPVADKEQGQIMFVRRHLGEAAADEFSRLGSKKDRDEMMKAAIAEANKRLAERGERGRVVAIAARAPLAGQLGPAAGEEAAAPFVPPDGAPAGDDRIARFMAGKNPAAFKPSSYEQAIRFNRWKAQNAARSPDGVKAALLTEDEKEFVRLKFEHPDWSQKDIAEGAGLDASQSGRVNRALGRPLNLTGALYKGAVPLPADL
jgi:hypothetical protein